MTKPIKLTSAKKAELHEASLKAIFVNNRVHISGSTCSIEGTCVDIVYGDICLTDVDYVIFSPDETLYTKRKSTYMMVPKVGKIIAIMED